MSSEEKKVDKKGAGRPQKEIDWDIVYRCLEAGCNGVQVAAYVGVHADTLYHAVKRKFDMNFSDFSAQYSSKGEVMLGLKQFQEAMKGDRGMLIWLGKQRLGQKENHAHQVEHSGTMTQLRIVHFGDSDDPQPFRNVDHMEES